MIFEVLSNTHYNKGIQLLKDNDLTNALEEFKKSVQYNENNWTAYNVMGLCLLKIGNFNEAKRYWGTSIKILPEDNVAIDYMEELETDMYKKIIENHISAIHMANNGDYYKAINLLSHNIELGYNSVATQNIYGICNYAVLNKNEAIKAFSIALDMDIKNYDTLRYLIETSKLKEKRNMLKWIRDMFN